MLYLPDDAVNIFTDGSSKPKPRRGGVGFRIVVTDGDGLEKVYDESPNGYPGATNNEMELRACIEALDFLRARRCAIDLAVSITAALSLPSVPSRNAGGGHTGLRARRY